MNEDELKAKKEAQQKELQDILNSPDDKEFVVPVICNIKLSKYRYGAYKSIMFMMETNELDKDMMVKREEFYTALFCVGIDDMVQHLTCSLLGGLLGNVLKKLDKPE